MDAYTYIHMHIYIDIHTHRYAMHMYIDIHTHRYTYIHPHTYKHTHTHTHPHLCMPFRKTEIDQGLSNFSKITTTLIFFTKQQADTSVFLPTGGGRSSLIL